MIARLRFPVLLAAVALVAMSCAESEPDPVAFSGDLAAGNPAEEEAEEGDASGEAPDPKNPSAEHTAELNAALAATPEGCDVVDTASCMLPFPSDFLTQQDTDSPTLRRVAFPEGQLPNASGTTFDPAAWNQLDGFSPSTPIVAYVPDIDEERTDLPPMSDIGMSITEDSATVLVDLDTGRLVPHWAELDERAENPEQRALIIHPATSLPETHRIAVVLRNMYGTDGLPVPTPVGFRAIRDNLSTGQAAIEDRKGGYDVVFDELASAGVARRDIHLMWWFTVASSKSLAGNVLSMRDDAMGALNGGAPEFEVTDVRTDEIEDGIDKVVEGTFEVPLYLDSTEPGATMTFDAAGRPLQSGEMTADFVCTVPEEAVTTGEARPVVYGHGLLGGADEAASSHVQVTAAEINAVYCSTDAIGLSEGDEGQAAKVASDINQFPPVSDRLQQAILNYLYLGRLMLNVDGLGTSEEFATDDGAIMLNTAEAYWDGNSQGAILGGAVTAVAQDWTKAVLGVGGMAYGTLLQRSVDFDPFWQIMKVSYPNSLEQQVGFGLLQMLWDRGETSGYVQHLTDRPYDLTPPHQVVMDVAFGDHQVTNVTADSIARALRIPLYEPTLPEDADVVPARQRFWNLSPIRSFPHTGSALYYWYSGTLPPPDGNITPIMGPLYETECAGAAADTDVACQDPHEDPRRQPEVIAQKDAFFRPDGVVVNVCQDEPCEAEPRDSFDY